MIAACILPNYTTGRAHECIDYISDLVGEIKRKFENCMITVAGDFNQWTIGTIVTEHPDPKEVEHGPTRVDRMIDKFFVNYKSKTKMAK